MLKNGVEMALQGHPTHRYFLPGQKSVLAGMVCGDQGRRALISRYFFFTDLTQFGCSPQYFAVMRDPLARFHSRYRYNREILPRLSRKMMREARNRSRNINDCVQSDHVECSYSGTLSRFESWIFLSSWVLMFMSAGGTNSLSLILRFHSCAETLICVVLWATPWLCPRLWRTLRGTTWWWGCWRCWRRRSRCWSVWCRRWWRVWWTRTRAAMSTRKDLTNPCQQQWWVSRPERWWGPDWSQNIKFITLSNRDSRLSINIVLLTRLLDDEDCLD